MYASTMHTIHLGVCVGVGVHACMCVWARARKPVNTCVCVPRSVHVLATMSAGYLCFSVHQFHFVLYD